MQSQNAKPRVSLYQLTACTGRGRIDHRQMQKNWQGMGSHEFYNCLKRAIQESATPPSELTSFLHVPNWPPTAHEIDCMLRCQQAKRYVERRSACSKLQDSYDLDNAMEAELMPILKENLPDIYRNNRI